MELNVAESDERVALLEAIEESLRPLMRAVFAYGISYHEFVDVVRALFIFTLRDRFVSQGRSASATHLGLMTGVNRGEVVKLVTHRDERDQERALAAKRFDQLTQLLAIWHDDPRFSTPYGAPLDLSLQPEGSFRLFDDLISTSGTDFDRDNAIAALCATGCVEVRAGKFVRCTSRTFLPAGKDLSRITRIGRVGAALHSTIVHNLLRSAKEPTYFERTMVSDFSLSDYGRDVMLAQLRVDGEDFIDSMDKWVSTKAADQIDEAGQRYGIAAFFFEDKRQPAGLASVPEALRAFESADSVN